MGVFKYIQFKLGYWVTVETLPGWVDKAHQKDIRNIRIDTGFENTYTGDSLKYRVVHRSKGRKVPPDTSYYVKTKER